MLKLLKNKRIVDKEIIYAKLNDYVKSFCLSQIEEDIKGRFYMMNLSCLEFKIEIDETNEFYEFGIRAINVLISMSMEPVVEHNHLFIDLNVHSYENEIYYCIKSIDVNSDFSRFSLNEEMAGFAINLVELNKNKSTLKLENFSIEDIENNGLDISNYNSISCNSWQVESLNKYHFKQLVIICNSVSRVRFLIKDINNLFSISDKVSFYILDSYIKCKNVLNEIDVLFYNSKLKINKDKYYILEIKKSIALELCEFITDCFGKMFDISIKEK